jgi:hypothetical protein
LEASGDRAAARASWQRADEILAAELAEAQPVDLLALRTIVLLHLERAPEAADLVQRLARSGYARPDLLRTCARHGLEPEVSGDLTAARR